MAKYKVGDKVKVGGHTATIVKILGTSASGEQMYGVKQDDNGWAYESLEGKMKAANASFKPGMKVWKQGTGKYFVGEVVKVEGDGISVKWPNGTTENIGSFQMRNIHAMNADVANGRHFSDPANDLADKIVKLVNKWLDAPKSKKDDAFNRLNTEIRAASSLGGGVWAMRDGTIAIAPEKPRGAQRLTDYLKTLNSKEFNTTIKSSNPVVANALKAKNSTTVASNSEVEITLRYASRAQSAMRDAVRAVSGAKISSTNTIECRSRDDAEEIVDILKMNAWIPDGEVWINSRHGRKVATNADTEASIDAEANKLYAQLKDIAKKFDALQSRLTKIKVYFYDYKETADGIRGLHGVMR